jgi:hypothetical protein
MAISLACVFLFNFLWGALHSSSQVPGMAATRRTLTFSFASGAQVPLQSFTPSLGPPYDLAICALVQNEAPYVAEWMAYHRILGFDHFILYDINSTDGLEAAVAPFAARNWVSIVRPNVDTSGSKVWSFQLDCFNRNERAKSARWLASIDPDEFLVAPGTGVSAQREELARLLKTYEELKCGGVLIDRYDFISGPHLYPPKGLVIENYSERKIHKAPRKKEEFSKVMGMPEYMVFPSVHNFQDHGEEWNTFISKVNVSDMKLKSCFVDGSPIANTINSEIFYRPKFFEPLRIQHYQLRSKAECLDKIKRRSSDTGNYDWRVRSGAGYCERGVHGGEGYLPEEHVVDRTLADSEWPEIIREFLEQL